MFNILDLQKLKDDEQSITQMKLAYEKQLQSERTLKTQVNYGKHSRADNQISIKLNKNQNVEMVHLNVRLQLKSTDVSVVVRCLYHPLLFNILTASQTVGDL